MKLPVTMWICDRCEQTSAMTSKADVAPGFWVERDQEQWCPDCLDRLEGEQEGNTTSGVVLTMLEACP